jgi:hypothetical protein
VVVVPRFTRQWIPTSGKAVPDWLRETVLSRPLAALGVEALLQSDGPASVRLAGDSAHVTDGDANALTFRAAAKIRSAHASMRGDRRGED